MSTGTRPPACVPTWRGHVETTKDALVLFEACLQGALQHCLRRPYEKERNSLIVSGNVFIYEETTSGIKRWTDGIPWSPSRILTNFLIYRQLDSPLCPGGKKRATKRPQWSSRPGEPDSTPPSTSNTPTAEYQRTFPPRPPEISSAGGDSRGADKESNRALVGSLVDSHEFKEHGLLKKTIKVTVRDKQYHLVSYYSLEDVKDILRTPRDDPRLKDVDVRPELLEQTSFKFPNLDDAGDGSLQNQDQRPHAGYYPPTGAHYYPYPYGNTVGYAYPIAYAVSQPPPPPYGMPPPSLAVAHPPPAHYGHYSEPRHYS